MPSAGSLEEDIIPFPIQVFAVSHGIVPVVDPVIAPAFAGRGLAVLRVKAAHVDRQAGKGHVVHGKVQVVGLHRALVGQRQPGRGGERHVEVGIQRLDGSHRQQGRLVGEILAQPEAVKVANRHFDRGSRLAIPPRPQHQVLQVVRIGRIDGEPDVRDDPSAGYVEQRRRLSRLHWHRVAIAPGPVPA